MKIGWFLLVLCLALPLHAASPDIPAAEVPTRDETRLIPYKQGEGISEKTLVKMGIVSVFGILLAVIAVVVLKKFLHRTQAGMGEGVRIQMESVRRVSPKLMLLIARVDDTEYLIAQSGEQVSVTRHRSLSPGETPADE